MCAGSPRPPRRHSAPGVAVPSRPHHRHLGCQATSASSYIYIYNSIPSRPQNRHRGCQARAHQVMKASNFLFTSTSSGCRFMDHHKTPSRVPPPYVRSHSLFFCLPVLLARSYFLSRSLIEPAGPWFAPRFDNMSLLRKVASDPNLP